MVADEVALLLALGALWGLLVWRGAERLATAVFAVAAVSVLAWLALGGADGPPTEDCPPGLPYC